MGFNSGFKGLMSSMVAKRVPLRPIFRAGNSQKSLGTRSGGYGGWVMIGMLFSARNCCTTGDVWLGANDLWVCKKKVTFSPQK